MPELLAATEASLKAYQERIKELEEALRPFAWLFHWLDDLDGEQRLEVCAQHLGPLVGLTVYDFRRAAKLLRK